jgi:catalase
MINDQGIKFLTQEEAAKRLPDHAQKDLYEAIERGEFPSLTLSVQTMSARDIEDLWENERINVFDLTHVWLHKQFPLREIGKLTLNENAKNYFAEIE